MGWLFPYRWRQRLPINSAVVDAELSDFPVLIVTDKVTSACDKKLAVTLDDGETECPVEVESSDATGALLWTKVETVSASSDTLIYLYYDTAAPDNSTVGYPNTAAGAAVWDDDFVLVDHMQDYGDTSHTVDSTSNNHDGAKTGAAEPQEATVQIGNGQLFDGSNDLVTITNTAVLQTATPFTVSFWMKLTQNAGWMAINEGTAFQPGCYYVFRADSDSIYALIYDNTAAAHTIAHAQNILNDLIKVDVVYPTSAKATMYIDGEVASQTVGDLPAAINANAGDLLIGDYAGGGNAFKGYIDEVRKSKVVRPAAWVKASYHSEANTLLTYGDVEPVAPYLGADYREGRERRLRINKRRHKILTNLRENLSDVFNS